ncbi:zf-HC2 domain-containing protein [Candidatus Binatus sp.]|uniref:zf-HC2 domain-containing protein n=1 Tax=Candidatus Binatus sp. TaxID=2811406 RepID=UPI003C73AA62
MPECGEIGLMLSAAGDGELEPRDLRKVARHVEGCAACTGELSDYSAIGRELRAIAVMPSLEGFAKSVLDVIAKVVAVALLAVALHAGILRLSVAHIAGSFPDTVASRPAPPIAITPAKLVDVRVDSAFVANPAFGSFSHASGMTESGKMIVFTLPGGKILHVQPRALEGGVIRMAVVLFDGGRATMTADLSLENGDTFALGGEKYGEGTIFIRISPTEAANAFPRPASS